MIGSRCRVAGQRPLLVVHGHRDGNAVGGQPVISSECVARVRVAEVAAREYRSELVLFCGAGTAGHPSEARQMASIWQGPPVRGFLDERSVDTAENAREARAWLHAHGASALIVVSSWWHVRLLGYYAGRGFREIPVRHARTRRCHRVLGHLAHETRYAPRLWRLRNANAGTGPIALPEAAQSALVLPRAIGGQEPFGEARSVAPPSEAAA